MEKWREAGQVRERRALCVPEAGTYPGDNRKRFKQWKDKVSIWP